MICSGLFQTTLTSLLVRASYSCHNKLPQPGWLKTTEMYYLTIVEARSSKSRYHQGCTPLGGSWRESVLFFFHETNFFLYSQLTRLQVLGGRRRDSVIHIHVCIKEASFLHIFYLLEFAGTTTVLTSLTALPLPSHCFPCQCHFIFCL